jgi:hypothetical protein
MFIYLFNIIITSLLFLLKELFEIQIIKKCDIDQHVNRIYMILVPHTCARSTWLRDGMKLGS